MDTSTPTTEAGCTVLFSFPPTAVMIHPTIYMQVQDVELIINHSIGLIPLENIHAVDPFHAKGR